MGLRLAYWLWNAVVFAAAAAMYCFIVWALDDLGAPVWVAGPAGLVILLVPLVGQGFAAYGIKNAFALSWPEAIGVIVAIIAMVGLAQAIYHFALRPGR